MASNEMTADDSRADAAKQAFLLNDPGFMQGVVQQLGCPRMDGHSEAWV